MCCLKLHRLIFQLDKNSGREYMLGVEESRREAAKICGEQ